MLTGGRLAAVGLVLLLAAPGPMAGQEGADPSSGSAHDELVCAACHRGPGADRGVGAVPAATCTDSDCHPDGGPAEVRVSTVVFRHRGHGDTTTVDLGCAGCHGHASGEAPITPTLAACGLCHADQLAGEDPSACLECHEQPRHVPVTNQGVPIPHGELPWIREGCVRCHFDVSRPRSGVSIGTCRSCHDDVEAVAEAGIGTDLHPSHDGLGCTTCHAPDSHDVVSMSAAVSLRCEGCHEVAHDVTVGAPGRPGTGACVDCHRDTHADQQRLVLGIVPGMPVSPSYKYLSGLGCGTCHADVEGRVPAGASLGGRPEACVACHRSEYRQVLAWWEEGAAQRVERVRSYRDRARRVLPSSDTVRTLLARAGVLVELVERTGAQHNLAFADELLRRGAELVESAYRAENRAAPSTPELGRRPRVGFCSYCHYRVGEPARFREMPEDFHEDVWDRFERLRERDREGRRPDSGPAGTGSGGAGDGG